jgi:hypothetical protein
MIRAMTLESCSQRSVLEDDHVERALEQLDARETAAWRHRM